VDCGAVVVGAVVVAVVRASAMTSSRIAPSMRGSVQRERTVLGLTSLPPFRLALPIRLHLR
jgi:hypothetical protein